METYEFFASCLAGFEQTLASELKTLKARRVRPLNGGVAFFGDAADALRVCLWTRVASRVSVVVGRVDAHDAEALYDETRALAWEDVLAAQASISVRAFGTNDQLRNTQFTALKVKDAVCDRMRAQSGTRPDVDARNAAARIEVRVHNGRATVSLDLSGGSLHERPYFGDDDGPDAARVVAAACGMLCEVGAPERLRDGWGLVDPASDAGFVVCEAAAMAVDMAPSLLRCTWGFLGWAAHDEETWSLLLDEADARLESGLSALLGSAGSLAASSAPNLDRVRVVGLSASSPAIAQARNHLRAAGLRGVASVEAASLEDSVDVVGRVAGIAKPAMIIGHVFSFDREVDDARAVAEEAAYMACARMALPNSLFAAVALRSLEVRFGVAPRLSKTIGAERTEAQLFVFDNPPTASCVLALPNPHGGMPRRVEVNDAASEQFAARLRKVYRERCKWAAREGISSYRVYDADLPEYNAAIDLYGGVEESWGKTFVHMSEYRAPTSVDPAIARRRFDDMLAIVPVVLDVRPDHVFSKVREHSKGGAQYRRNARRSYVAYTEESGCLFEIELAAHLDTGLFLDQRLTRALVGSQARGKDFLNLFAYTGSASVLAAHCGAVSTTTVDLSQTYLDWARRNMELNGFTGRRHAFERADAMTWLKEARRARRRFDVAFVDPPTFSNSKAMGQRTWDVQRDHVELLINVVHVLAPDGMAVFACNLRSFKPDVDRLARYGVALEDITADTIPYDFARNPRIHKCYIVTRT